MTAPTPAENVAPDEQYLAWDSATLNRAADHGCLDENVETGDPVVCAMCITSPTATGSRRVPVGKTCTNRDCRKEQRDGQDRA